MQAVKEKDAHGKGGRRRSREGGDDGEEGGGGSVVRKLGLHRARGGKQGGFKKQRR